MGIKKKYVPGCTCCGGCVYSASDGNEYSDDFTVLDPGWLTAGGVILSISSGQLLVDGQTFAHGFCYRGITVTGTDFLIIMESQWYSVGTTNTQLLFIGDHSTATAPNGWGFYYGGIPAVYSAIYGNGGSSSVIGSTPANGDKLTLQIKALGNGDCRLCFFINEELVLQVVETISASEFVDYGMMTEIFFNQLFDNFSIHNGNP